MRHHPRGKLVLEKLGGKQYIMKHMANKEHATVRYEALIAVQKLMTQNWGTLGQQLKVSTAECGGGGVGTGDIGTVLHTEEKDAQSVFFNSFLQFPYRATASPTALPFPFSFPCNNSIVVPCGYMALLQLSRAGGVEADSSAQKVRILPMPFCLFTFFKNIYQPF